jgi:hypothetical protein
MDKVNWDRAVKGVLPFLERQADLKLLTKENSVRLLQNG